MQFKAAVKLFKLFFLTLRAPALHSYVKLPWSRGTSVSYLQSDFPTHQTIVFFRIAKQNLSFCCKEMKSML